MFRKHLSFAAAFVASEFPRAGVAELADALDSKSSDRKIVWVRAPPPASPLKYSFTWVNRIDRGENPLAHGNALNRIKTQSIRQPFVNGYPPADDRMRNRNFINVASLYFQQRRSKNSTPVTC
jgi:hypothetical protein